MHSRPRLSFAALGWMIAGALVLPAATALAQQPGGKAAAPYERRAEQTVRGWIAAFGAGDADKAASYFEDDVQFRMEAALNRNIETGRENAHQQLKKLFDRISHNAPAGPGPHVQAGTVQLTQIDAVGGNKEVLVITRRIDSFTLNGRPFHLPVGSFFRVNAQSGKIEEWLDIPLIDFNRNPPPPPSTGK